VARISPAYTAQNPNHIGSVYCTYNKKTKIDLWLKLKHNNNNLGGSSGHQKVSKRSREYSFNQKHLKSGAKEVLLQMYHIVCEFPRHAQLP